jgi:hypothetical protein
LKAQIHSLRFDGVLLLNTYDREVTLIVGRELERLSVYVYENPMPTSDIAGNARQPASDACPLG